MYADFQETKGGEGGGSFSWLEVNLNDELPLPPFSSLSNPTHNLPSFSFFLYRTPRMVQITVQHRSSSKSSGKPAKPPVVIDFPHRHPNKVSVLELKGAIEAKFPRVSLVPS